MITPNKATITPIIEYTSALLADSVLSSLPAENKNNNPAITKPIIANIPNKDRSQYIALVMMAMIGAPGSPVSGGTSNCAKTQIGKTSNNDEFIQ